VNLDRTRELQQTAEGDWEVVLTTARACARAAMPTHGFARCSSGDPKRVALRLY